MKPQTSTLVLGHLVKTRKYSTESADLHTAVHHNAQTVTQPVLCNIQQIRSTGSTHSRKI